MILLDTNFILRCIEKKTDFSKGVVPYEVILELKNLQNKAVKLKDKVNAKIAFDLINKREFKKIKLGFKVDTGLVKLDEKEKEKGNTIYIATNDRVLKNRLKNKAKVLNLEDFRKI